MSESSLPGLVGDLRAVLGDDPKQPRFIRTVLRYGYAFCGDVVVGGAGPACAPRWTAAWDAHTVLLPDGEHLIGRGEDCRSGAPRRGSHAITRWSASAPSGSSSRTSAAGTARG